MLNIENKSRHDKLLNLLFILVIVVTGIYVTIRIAINSNDDGFPLSTPEVSLEQLPQIEEVQIFTYSQDNYSNILDSMGMLITAQEEVPVTIDSTVSEYHSNLRYTSELSASYNYIVLVRAGVDFSDISIQSLEFNKLTGIITKATVQLPPAEIVSATINYDKLNDPIINEYRMTDTAKKLASLLIALRTKVIPEVEDRARLHSNILVEAEGNAEDIVEEMLFSLRVQEVEFVTIEERH